MKKIQTCCSTWAFKNAQSYILVFPVTKKKLVIKILSTYYIY